MDSVQLSFKMRTSVGVKTVHLLGSWDGYTEQLPLGKDKSSSKAGSWKGTFRFPGNLEPGQRYWYYYIIDGYHVSHDPAESYTVEPTTGRKLNVLDVPYGDSKSSSRSKSSKDKHSSSSKNSSRDKHKHSSSSSRRESRRDDLNLSLDIPKGRPLSTSKIQSPKPISPGAAQFLQAAYNYEPQTVEELTQRFAATSFEEDVGYDVYSASPPSSVGSSLSSRSGSSSGLSSTSSMSDYSSGSASPPPACTCERYGITRHGDRIKLDCGGSRCGYIDDASSPCSDDSQEYPRRGHGHSSRRHEPRVRR